MRAIEKISKAIGSIFLLASEAGPSYKINLISKLIKPEVRNIKH